MCNRIFFIILLILPGILSAQSRPRAEDPFDELVREKKEIFGSEKEEKYPIRMLIVDWESWEGHSSWHAFWFIRRTDYPKYKQFRIFPLYNSIEAKSGRASLDYLFPVFSYRRVEAEGVEEKTLITPLNYRNTIQPVGVGYRESTNFYWLGYNSSSSGPGFEKSFNMFPGFFPLFTRRVELNNGLRKTHTMFLPALYFNTESPEESTTVLTLFRWGHDLEKKFFHFFPLFHYTNYKIREDYSFTFFPFYHQSRSNVQSQGFASYSPFWFRESEKTSDAESDFLFLPIPLFYKSKTVSQKGQSTIFLLALLTLYVRDDEGENYKIRNFLSFQWGKEKNRSYFRFLPFVFYKENSHFNLFPFYFSWKDEEKADNVAGPFYYRYRSPDVFQDYYFNTYYKRERGKGFTEIVSFPLFYYKENSYFTLIPFYHHSYDGEDFTRYYLLPIPMYKHSRNKESETLVLNAYWSRDEKGEYKSSAFFPFYFHKKNSYLHIPLLLVFHTQSKDWAETIAPFFYKYSSQDENEFFLLGYHSFDSDSKSFTRLYPFYYSSNEKDGSSFLGWAGLFYRWKDSQGETVARAILPLHYYQKNEYNLWFPFYYRFGRDDRNYVSFSPVHYRLRSTNADRDWVLFYYSSENREERTSSRFMAPFYFEWKNPNSKGDILLPAYIKYYEKNKNLELYFGGISVSQTGGKFDASFRSIESGKEFYVDLDYSFIYNIFSVSLRREIANLLVFFTDEKKEKPVLQIQNVNSPESKKVSDEIQQISSKKNVDFASYKKLARENSRNYFGWEALFGIASYQSGDEKKHFRILPLGWFTWGTNSNDKIFAFPLPLPTFWGTVGNESYRVVFPLYAEQKKGDDFILSLGIFLFVMEREKDRREYSILWPLTHYAKSKEEISYRFFPFFAHKETADRLETKSIFYYRSEEKTGIYESSSFHGILFPFYQTSEETFTKKYGTFRSGYDLFFPFYYRDYEDRIVGGVSVLKERNLYTPLFLYSSSEDSSQRSKDSFLLSPLYLSSHRERFKFNDSYVSDLNMILPIPFVFWGQDGVEKYYYIFLFYQTESKTNDENYYSKAFYPILPLPFLFTFREKVRTEFSRKDVWGFDWLLFANYENTKHLDNGKEATSLKLLFSMFGYETGQNVEKQETSSYFNSYLFPLFFYKSVDRKEFDSYRWFVVPIVVYRSFREKQGKIRSHTNLFGILFDYKRDDEVGTESYFVFPSIYYSSDTLYKEKTFFVLPFFYSSSSVREERSAFFLLGYYQSRNSVANRYNFLYLFDLESSFREQKKELTLFLGVFNAEFEKDRTRWGVFGGVLVGYESTPQMIDWNFLWIRYLNSPREKIQNFLPIYRYGETQEGYSFLAPPLLTYHSKDVEGTLTLGGLGLVYYRNHSEIDQEDSTKILGGLFYFSEKKAARGYRNHGVFGFPLIGGLLWNYEYEEETDFKKISILKFVFSRTTYKGRTWNSYFGISPSLWFDDRKKNDE
ncbi:LA_1737 family protein [Leptospira santarosai]|uniref:Uncharacterized protein n=1 Tax=Leptospira santarosai str. ZUN179 TaxID=1049985 RepID=M6UPD0_9LEPT|nr:hypothetical protein [Leptospira santarosai]EMO46445.1 hypothetical protein LEP1GSC187_1372 [Leptospira santarosai str. ZUN179]